MKHVNYLSFFLLTLFSISFISCSDDDDNKLTKVSHPLKH